MEQEVLLVLLNEYADWESAFLAAGLRTGGRYVPRVVGPTREVVVSIGGFRTLPDYDFQTVPEEYAALVLIGGTGWQSEEAKGVVELVQSARERGKVVAGICNGASFLAAHGFLNDVRHTGNTLEQLKLWGGERYTNEMGYVERQAVADGGMVTANGTGYLEFSRELLLLLEANAPERIESDYAFQKNGLYTA
ncbi:type 1 glutamine amidotransferase family protein [uncultured Rikenella sp.]|uniref:type 1 glutamine amidotransferase family protein n=1 Tax=uncultured Rikenella sp. TaxID=368003 RepID=UPI0025F340C9|nr:type 1 glutamine amidotransferase family protein [uncultured Rikenella sp.]